MDALAVIDAKHKSELKLYDSIFNMLSYKEISSTGMYWG